MKSSPFHLSTPQSQSRRTTNTTTTTPTKAAFAGYDNEDDNDEGVLSPGTLEFLDDARDPTPSWERSQTEAIIDSPPGAPAPPMESSFSPAMPMLENAPTAEPATTTNQSQREEEESVALARALMAEEAMAVSYHMSVDYLRNNRDQFSEQDLAALQAAMDDDEEPEEAGDEQDESNLSYDMMLRLGEALGDVKSERWARVAQEKIRALPCFSFDPKSAEGKDENDCEVKCLVCQFSYEKDDNLRRLPCGHCFHSECVDQWLMSKDFCPYCRTAIVEEEDDDDKQS